MPATNDEVKARLDGIGGDALEQLIATLPTAGAAPPPSV